MTLAALQFHPITPGAKVYAQTPSGELAFGDSQGLYEWRNGVRIDYTGGDRQGSSGGQMWTSGPVGMDPTPEALRHAAGPKRRGFQAALSRRRLN